MEVDDIDECIKDSRCEGNCNDIAQARRLKELKESGGKRCSLLSKPEQSRLQDFSCNLCKYRTKSMDEFKRHKTTVHEFICPICGGVFKMKSEVENHINTLHKENRSSNQHTYNKRPCRFYNQQGCKKGRECDFLHENKSQGQTRIKIQKLCRNEGNCSWKPIFKFIHLEDGEELRVIKNVARLEDRQNSYRESSVLQRDCGVSHPPGFGPCQYSLRMNQQWNQNIRKSVIMRVPNLRSMEIFPSLPLTEVISM